jgi:hypothetical protein
MNNGEGMAIQDYAVNEANISGEIDGIINLFSTQMEWCTDTFAQTLGYEKDELIGISARHLLDISPRMLMEALHNLFDKEKIDTRILKRKNGEKIKITADIKSFKYSGEPFLAITNVVFEEIADET